MQAEINGQKYRIEFSYRRRVGKYASLARNSPIEGLSACAIVSDGTRTGISVSTMAKYPGVPSIVSVAASVCSAGDRWSRREGRKQAFRRAVMDCGLLREHASDFLIWFYERFPEPGRTLALKHRMSDEEIARRREEGRARKSSG